MDPYILVIALLVCVATGLIVYALMPRGSDEKGAIKRRLAGRRGVDEEAEIRQQARKSATDGLVRKATPMLSKLVMPTSDEEQTHLRGKLASAGYRQAQAQTLFLASKTIGAIALAVVCLVGGLAGGLQWPMLLGLAALGAGAGMMLPNLWLSLAISGRQQKIREGLPDALDLLVVSVESGLALDAALKRVGDEMAPVHPEMSEELRISTMEAQMGLPRGEALNNMARRAGVDELRSLVSVITQAEKFGTSVAKALRNQAEALRTKRRQAAEERAQKTAVKLMIPLVLFIFPAMFVVLGGPAVINVLKAMKENPTLTG
ncbi:MAG: type II secretion system F family protein [Phycisphaerales bacterium]|nr:type II secretion system F family protein [Phycisphaerales bacterium]